MKLLSPRRLWALCRKETYQIVRDPSSILMAFVMPIGLLFVLGYAVNLDVNNIRIGVLRDDDGGPAMRLEQSLAATPAFEVHHYRARATLMTALAHGDIRGAVIIRNDFSKRWLCHEPEAGVQVLTDGSQPNSANFVDAYMQGAWNLWQRQEDTDHGAEHNPPIAVDIRTWFNPSAVSRNFLIPGSIALVMTIIGALLTSLVVAREWERGTMEALLATPVTRAELLLSKILPYYLLGMIAQAICLVLAVTLMGVPFRGSVLALFGIATLFLGSALGLGLFLSSLMRDQFNAAQAALVAAFLPALMLSGVIFEITSMPAVLRWLTHIIPARYFASALQTLFQAGDVPGVLLIDAFYLGLLMIFWLALTAKFTRRTLD